MDTIKIVYDNCNHLQNRHIKGKSCIVGRDYFALWKNSWTDWLHQPVEKFLFKWCQDRFPWPRIATHSLFTHRAWFILGVIVKLLGTLISSQRSHDTSFGLPYAFSPCMLQIWKKTPHIWAGETKQQPFPCLSSWPIME